MLVPTGNHGDPLGEDGVGGGLLVGLDGEVAVAVVDQVAARAPHVDRVAEGEALQVLGHLPAVRELGVDPLEVDLEREKGKRC